MAKIDHQKSVFEVKDSNSEIEGYLVIDSLSNGMAFGGFRIDTSVTREMVCELAQCMTWKLAGHGSPVGGAKGGIRCSPADPRFPAFLKRFAEECRKPLATLAIVGKDLGATNEILDSLYENLGFAQLKIVQEKYPDRNVPGKLRDLGGYRKHMTGLGVAWSAHAYLKEKMKGARIVIQGFGAVGAGAAVRFSELGAVVVGVSDHKGAFYHAGGLPYELMMGLVSARGEIDRSRCDFPHLELPRDELFSQDADVAVLAATSSSVTASMAHSLRAPLVIEGSNFGLTFEARNILQKRDIFVIPDIIASSSSGAMVAHQLSSGNSYAPEKMWIDIQAAIERSVIESVAIAKEKKITVRDAYLHLIS